MKQARQTARRGRLRPPGSRVALAHAVALPYVGAFAVDYAGDSRADRATVRMNRHAFEIISSSASPTAERFAELLSPDVVFHPPIFVHPVTGRDFVTELLETVHGIFGRPTYRLRLSEGRDTVVQFDGEVDGDTLQVAVVIRRRRGVDPGAHSA